ncbi:MAG: tetratricopeptide repeat protein [Methanothrix sp.]|nr:tetratricopeptide repeat protein [Methanothrix sp.]
MFPRVHWLCIVLLIGSAASSDVPFVFDSTSSGVAGYSADQLESMRASSPDLAGVPLVTTPSDDEVLQFPVTGGGSTPGNTTEKNAGDLKKALDARVEPDNSRVRDEAVVLALKYPGEKTIEQIASIYNYLKKGDGSKKGWGYVSDPRGIDYFMFANQTLKNGDRANCVGGGDCDDFAILMSALIESIGGTTRIILARNSSIGGHAYTEVYLGNLRDQYNQVDEIINWLKQNCDTDKIYTHIDTDTKDVWLNMDWGEDEKGNTHPGGPFFQGDKHIVLCIRDRYEKTALKLSEPSQDGDNQSTIVPPVTVSLEGDSDVIASAREMAAEDWYNKGVTVFRQGEYDEATRYFDEAIRLDPNYAIAWYDKGASLYRLHRYDEALQAYDEAIKLDPSNVNAWYNKGATLDKQGKLDEAIRAYDEAIRLDPNNADIWYDKAIALGALGRNSESMQASNEAIKLDPNYADPSYDYGVGHGILYQRDRLSPGQIR